MKHSVENRVTRPSTWVLVMRSRVPGIWVLGSGHVGAGHRAAGLMALDIWEQGSGYDGIG